MKSIKTRLHSYIIVMILILFDQITKFYAIKVLRDEGLFVILSDTLELYYLESTDSALKMIQGGNLILKIISLFIIILIIYFFSRTPDTKKYTILRLSFLLLTAGAISNVLDHIIYNHVINFISFKLINFPTFNIADLYIVIALCIISFFVLLIYKEDNGLYLYNKKREND